MPNTPGPDVPPAVSIGHEPHRFNIGGVVKAAVALAVVCAIASLIASGVMSALEPSERRVDTTGRYGLPQDLGKIRAPVLQDANAEDLIALRKKEAAMLAATEWVDRKQGIVRIPIERAMELLVKEKGR
jgi:hypothetical protein